MECAYYSIIGNFIFGKSLYRNIVYKGDYKKQIPDWIFGFALSNEVQTLSLSEYRKTKNHENATIIDLQKLIIHEFTHAAHNKIHNNCVMIWLTEGLATTLAHQYDDKKLKFDATLDEIKMGKLVMLITM